MLYNGISVPPLIRVDRIISAFENDIDEAKIEEYTKVMQREMLSHDFPPIMGYPFIITEDDIGRILLTGEEIEEEHIGCLLWCVTDGHHRSISAINANLPHFEVKLDYSTITSDEDLNQFSNK